MAYDLIRSNDLIDNPTPRCACLLVLDTSGSMAGAAIDELNAGVQLFIETVHADEVAACSVEIAVVTAGGSVRGEIVRADLVLQGGLRVERLRITALPELSAPLLGMDVLGRLHWRQADGELIFDLRGG